MKKTTNRKIDSTRFSSLDSRFWQFGQLSIQILLLGFLTMIILVGLIDWSDVYIKSITRERNKSLAFAIAESGVEYYRWHLAHSKNDFTDGVTSSPPYIHPYYDKDGNRLGQFELTITEPATGSTIVAIHSVGKIDADPTVSKAVDVRLGLPFIGQYAVLANGNIKFLTGVTVNGKIHANGGIRFDGLANNVVYSARETYDDPDHSGSNEFGVHTHVSPTDPLPPSSTPVRTDVFAAGRTFPVPAIDFSAFTRNLATIKADAQANGYYKGKSNAKGYEIVLKTNDTFDLYKVTGLKKLSKDCKGSDKKLGSWSINTKTLVSSGVSFPANNLIFIEDHVWVSGQLNTARLTIAAGRFPQRKNKLANIIVNNDLTYTNFDGQDVLGLIAQGDFLIGLEAEDDLVIDAALVSQNGQAAKKYYSSKCGDAYKRTKLTLYGMIATNKQYGFAFTDGTGFGTRIINYDANLLYSPPPAFPTIGNLYNVISWDEVK